MAGLASANPEEQVAANVRAFLGLDDMEPVADIVTAIEEGLGIPVFMAPLPAPVAGMAQRQDGEWYVAVDSARTRTDRLRFTLAHEAGHVVLDHAPGIDDASTLPGGQHSGRGVEAEANRFAAALLVPRGMLERQREQDPRAASDPVRLAVTVAALAGTSRWVPFYRACTLGLVEKPMVKTFEDALKAMAGQEDQLRDVAAGFARTGRVRMPADHEARMRELGHFLADDVSIPADPSHE